jgi:hypothetical protein
MSFRIYAVAVAAVGLMASTPVAAQRPAARPADGPMPVVTQGGSLPLEQVLAVAKPYPNLLLQVRLELVRANLKRDAVSCGAGRYDARWATLSGNRLAPYECKIGKRTLVITAAQTFYDRNGRRLVPTDAATPAKAATVRESGLKWSWK